MRPRRPVTDVPRRRSILVITEGTKTEPQYIKHWHRRYRSGAAVIVDTEAGTDPRSLVDAALEELRAGRRQERRGKGSAYTSIWVVFDCDEHPHVKEQVDRATNAGIRVAFSNPCVELWFLLHFVDQTAHIHRHAAQAACGARIAQGKAISQADLAHLEAEYATARQRAQALTQRHIGDGSWEHANPSTSMWALIDEIIGEA